MINLNHRFLEPGDTVTYEHVKGTFKGGYYINDEIKAVRYKDNEMKNMNFGQTSKLDR